MIYLDSAATTFQKPKTVMEGVQRAFQTMSSPGRGGYGPAMQAAETLFTCREELGALFHVENPERVVFVSNATHALNLAIKSLVPPGGKAVISGYEHNAVTRPLAALNAKVSVAAAPLFRPDAVLSAFRQAITPDTDAVICNHVSNVFGFLQPVEAIAHLCRERKVPFVVDASQSAGILELDLEQLGADFIAMPGHKGLYGPQGTGVLLCGREAPTHLLMEGGTGSLSRTQEMPDFLPDRLEPGTHNVPGIAGLLEGVRFVRRLGPAKILRHERELARMTAECLRQWPGVRVYAAEGFRAQTGVVSFTVDGQDAEVLAEKLGKYGVAVRAGLHCAPLAHRSAGTLESGTIRLSFSVFNTLEQVRSFFTILRRILA